MKIVPTEGFVEVGPVDLVDLGQLEQGRLLLVDANHAGGHLGAQVLDLHPVGRDLAVHFLDHAAVQAGHVAVVVDPAGQVIAAGKEKNLEGRSA